MSAPTGSSPAPTDAQEAAEAATLLDALARAPAAAALVVAALDRLDDRRALRLAHPQLRDAVGEAMTKLEANLYVHPTLWPTPRRWLRLEELTITWPDLAALKALGSGVWASLRTLTLQYFFMGGLGAPAARALAAALRRMPALRALQLWNVELSDAAAEELFDSCRAEAAPRLRSLTVTAAKVTPAAARALAATGWRLEELNLRNNAGLGAAGVAALVAAPTFALRRLNLEHCSLDAAALLALADAPWPLEELELDLNNFSAAAAGPALAALSRHARLRVLNVSYCRLSAASFRALVEAAWHTLTSLGALGAEVALDGPHALGAAAFAGFPALEELDLSSVRLGAAGAALLAGRRWTRLVKLDLHSAWLGDAGVAALARGAWPALEVLDLRGNGLAAPPTLDDVRRWAPALEELLVDGEEV